MAPITPDKVTAASPEVSALDSAKALILAGGADLKEKKHQQLVAAWAKVLPVLSTAELATLVRKSDTVHTALAEALATAPDTFPPAKAFLLAAHVSRNGGEPRLIALILKEGLVIDDQEEDRTRSVSGKLKANLGAGAEKVARPKGYQGHTVPMHIDYVAAAGRTYLEAAERQTSSLGTTLRFPAGTQRPATLVQSFHAIAEAAKALHREESKPKEQVGVGGRSAAVLEDNIRWAQEQIAQLRIVPHGQRVRKAAHALGLTREVERSGALLRALYRSPEIVDNLALGEIVSLMATSVRKAVAAKARAEGDTALAGALTRDNEPGAVPPHERDAARRQAAVNRGLRVS